MDGLGSNLRASRGLRWTEAPLTQGPDQVSEKLTLRCKHLGRAAYFYLVLTHTDILPLTRYRVGRQAGTWSLEEECECEAPLAEY